KLPPEAIAQIADDTRNERADEFGVRQVELYHNADGQVYCLLDGPDEDAIRKHHAAPGAGKPRPGLTGAHGCSGRGCQCPVAGSDPPCSTPICTSTPSSRGPAARTAISSTCPGGH